MDPPTAQPFQIGTSVSYNNTFNFYNHIAKLWEDMHVAKKNLAIHKTANIRYAAFQDWFDSLKEIFFFAVFFYNDSEKTSFEKQIVNIESQLGDRGNFFFFLEHPPTDAEQRAMILSLEKLQKELFMAQGRLNMLLSLKKHREYENVFDEIEGENI